MRILVGLAAMALSAASCSSTNPTFTTTTSSPPPTSTTTPTTTTSAPTTEPPPTLPVCQQGSAPFAYRGVVATLGEGEGDAAAIGGVRWASHNTCERIVIDLVTSDGAPAANLGEASVEFRPDIGLIRVELPTTATGLADSLIEGALVDRVFVVRQPSGNLAVDIHLGTNDPLAVRGFDLTEPTRVVVDIARDDAGTGRMGAPAISDLTVVLSPVDGPAEYPLLIGGYTRTFEANITAVLLADGVERDLVFGTATDWLDAWGAFELELRSGPLGPVEVLVGDTSAATGEFEGVTLNMDMT